MTNRHGTIYSQAAVITVATRIKGVIFDGDGVLTNNRVLEGISDVKPRWRSHYDGQGISLLRAIGIRICFITNESGVAAEAIKGLVERWNNLPSCTSGVWSTVELFEGRGGERKVEAAEKWLLQYNLCWADCAVMGDDLVDVSMLRKAGLKVAPSSAELVVLGMAEFVSRRPGGSGAIRDLANFILEMRNVDPTTLPTE